MKKVLILFAILSSTILSVKASDAIQSIQNLSKYNRNITSDTDKLACLKELCGDTISFEFPEKYSHLSNFSKSDPDTIWIKNRPKKNPVEGKHYTLSFTYKGELTSEGYFTPAFEINGKKFGVLSVDVKKTGTYYLSDSEYIFGLIDLDDLSVVKCSIPCSLSYEVTLTSNKVDRLIDSIKNTTCYVNTGSSYSPDYTHATLTDGSYKIVLDYPIIKSVVDIKFVSDSDETVPFKFDDKSYYKYYTSDSKTIISEDEYRDSFVTRIITSEIDEELAYSDIALPFDFTFIIGKPKNSIKDMSQTINPTEVKSYSWAKDYKSAPEKAMFVGGTETVKGVQFYKMIHNGKAFFMKAEDVSLSPEYELKLDSLKRASDEIKNYFFHHSLALSKSIYIDNINNCLKELEGYKKDGVAIFSWGVYDESEYTDGTSLEITFYNPSEQIIKYISFTFQGYNAVDDPVGGTITRKCIGPIEPNGSAYYDFDYIWFTDIVEYAKLRSLTVTYKNGTTKTISKPSTIVFSDKLRDMLDSPNPVKDFN